MKVGEFAHGITRSQLSYQFPEDAGIEYKKGEIRVRVNDDDCAVWVEGHYPYHANRSHVANILRCWRKDTPIPNQYGNVPRFHDRCGHGGFIETIYDRKGIAHDLYVHNDNQVCLRFGNETKECIGMNLIGFLRSSRGDDLKNRAIQIMIKYGKIIYVND